MRATPLEPLFPGSSSGSQVRVQFSQRRSGGESPEAEIRIHARPPGSTVQLPNCAGELRFTITCESGRATIENVAEIEWQVESTRERESLTADRTETEVMLDHFCRRVAGGLIPVADIADVHRCFQMALAAEEGLATGKPVGLAMF